jgi:hypothetical protein
LYKDREKKKKNPFKPKLFSVASASKRASEFAWSRDELPSLDR